MRKHGIEIALLLVLACAWASSYTLVKIAVATIPPLTLTAGRTATAALLLIVIMHVRGIKFPTSAATWQRLMVQGSLNTVLPFSMIAWAMRSVEASLATILNSTTPIWAFLLTAMVTRHEAVTGRKLLGVLAGMAGLCLIVGLEAFQGIGREFAAQLALVLAAVCYACAVILGARLTGVPPMATAAGTMLCGAVMLVPICLAVDQPWNVRPSGTSLAAAAALSIFSTALAYVIYFRLIRTLGSVGTTAQAYIRVPIGVMLGVVFLHEELGPADWIGLVCVVAGVAAMTIPERKTVPAAR